MFSATKQCSNCKQLKPLSEFDHLGRIYRSHCKECGRGYIREHYHNNKDYYLEKNRRKRERLQQLLHELKSKPCADCGQVFPYYVMDFDHLDGEQKTSEVNRLIRSLSLSKIQREIAKCEVVCANCHRKRTFERLNSKRL